MPAGGSEAARPSLSRFLALLGGCRAAGHLYRAHAFLVTSGLSQHLLCAAKFLIRCIEVLPNHGLPLLNLGRQDALSSRVWSAAMRECSMNSRREETVAIFLAMLRCGVLPDPHAYPLILKAVARSKHKDPVQIHARVVKSGFGADLFVQNALVSCYAAAGFLSCAGKLFEGMPEKDSITWTCLIRGFVKNNVAAEGLRLFLEMRRAPAAVDEVTIVSVLSGCGALGNIWFGSSIHGLFLACGRLKRDVYVDCALIDMYAKCGRMEDAQEVFVETPHRNVVSWTAMITGYIQCSRYSDALDALRDMVVEGLVPNEVTLSGTLAACAHMGALQVGRCAHGFIYRHILIPNLAVGTALIDMYAKCGCIDEALATFDQMPQKEDVHPWTAMINGLALHGCAPECLNIFSRMLDERIQPNEVTFMGVLSACSHGALLLHGRRYFNEMSAVYGIEPQQAHYGCMVGLLGRAGRLAEALQLIDGMPMNPSPGVWGALLGACATHRSLELGECVGEHLIALQPHHGGRYVIVANMYSEGSNWEEAARIRMLMKKREVGKRRGCSWIEVNGVVHEFISSDPSHSSCKDIHLMLDAMGLESGPRSSPSDTRAPP